MKEVERTLRVSDMLLTMHCTLRDRFSTRCLVMDVILLVTAIALNVAFFMEESILRTQVLEPEELKTAMGLFSTVVFVISLISLRVDWKAKAERHGHAASILALVKAEARELSVTACAGGLASERCRYLAATISCLPPIPERDFNKLKAVHLRKVEISKLLSQNPGAPVALLVFRLWLGCVCRVLGRGFISRGAEVQDGHGETIT